MTTTDDQRTDYRQKKAYFDGLLTLFGRNPVLEALKSPDVTPVRLHLAASNRDSAQLREIRELAAARSADTRTHTRETLARISKNRRQDQGVALDIRFDGYRPASRLLAEDSEGVELLALDHVTNPQNVGMIVRSVAASPMHGLLFARRGNAAIDGLVIKASAGALFRARIYHCETLAATLRQLRERGFRVHGLAVGAGQQLDALDVTAPSVFVLGNETAGLTPEIEALCDDLVSIPLENGVESLNVSVAASLVAFRSLFQRQRLLD